jgi:hypothetical protein
MKPVVIPKLRDNERYVGITSQLKQHHSELLKLESAGKLSQVKDSPLVGDYLAKLRLNVNLLFAFLNNYLDVHSDLTRELAAKRQTLYEEQLADGKSPSAAETHSKQLTRIDEATVKVVENQMQQIKNEYERFNGICMMLQSRLKEFNTERIVG